MTYHRRSDWTPRPAANAHPFDPDDVLGNSIHWNGPPVSAAALADPRVFLRGVLRFHTVVKKWSDIAYNLAVDQQGQVWELRGLGHRSGANGDETTNRKYVAVFCVIGEGQQPSNLMLAGVRKAVALTRKKYPNATRIVGHQQIRPEATACPGPDLMRAIRGHDLEPVVDAPPYKPPKETGMKLTDKITIPADYQSNPTDKPQEVSVEDAFRRIYEWSYLAAHGTSTDS